MKVLFLTWDSGDVDYLVSLFFPVFEALRDKGVEVHTLQATWGSKDFVRRTSQDAEARGLSFRSLAIAPETRKKQLPLHLARFFKEADAYARAHNIQVLLPRAIVPSSIALALKARRPSRVVLWDADGLPADERVDFVGWSKGDPRYVAMRALELTMLQSASRVMVRTQRAAEILSQRALTAPPMDVVPNGRDEALYMRDERARDSIRQRLGVPDDAPLIVSVGSVGPQYLPQAQAQIVRDVLQRWPQGAAVFLTAQHAQITSALTSAGVPMDRVSVMRVAPSEVPHYLSAADVGLALRQPAFSQQAVCPLKVGEYLLASLPVVSTRGVGDLDQTLSERVAFFVQDDGSYDDEALQTWLLSTMRQRSVGDEARRLGLAHFSLGAAVDGYFRFFSELSGDGPKRV